MSFLDTPEGHLVAALGVGLVIGAERERRRGEIPSHLPAGIRTFGLVALLGGVFASLDGTALLAIGAVAVATMALLAYVLGDRNDPSLTTEVALLLTYGLGALAVRAPLAALATALCAATLLAFRATLHETLRSIVTEAELRDALLLGVAALVVLPLVPNHAVDPLGVVNPFLLWRLVVLFMGMSAAGYIAQRAIGPRYGLALAGFASGFVSSAATIAAMGARAHADRSQVRPAAAGAAASSVATIVQLAILIGAADPRLLARLGWPLVGGGAVAILFAVLQTVRGAGGQAEPDRGHAFRIGGAVAFAALVAGVSLASALAQRWAGAHALLATTALAGLADTHSAAAAIASVSSAGRLDLDTAALGVLLSFTTNTFTKCAMAVSSRERDFYRPIVAGLVILLAAVWAAYAVVR